MIIISNIGKRIRELRIQKGLSQKDLGKILNVSQQMVAQYENSADTLKPGTIKKIADALECDVNKLVDTNYLLDIADKSTNAFWGVLDILQLTYHVKLCDIQDNGHNVGDYYLLSDDTSQFILLDKDIDMLNKSACNLFKTIIDAIKDDRKNIDGIKQQIIDNYYQMQKEFSEMDIDDFFKPNNKSSSETE